MEQNPLTSIDKAVLHGCVLLASFLGRNLWNRLLQVSRYEGLHVSMFVLVHAYARLCMDFCVVSGISRSGAVHVLYCVLPLDWITPSLSINQSHTYISYAVLLCSLLLHIGAF